MAELNDRAMERLQTAYQTAAESYVLYGEMDNESCYGRLEFIAELLADVLLDLGVDVERLAREAVTDEFSPFAPEELDYVQAVALRKINR